MPAYKGKLSEGDIAGVLAYMRGLSGAKAEVEAKPAAEAKPEAAAGPDGAPLYAPAAFIA